MHLLSECRSVKNIEAIIVAIESDSTDEVLPWHKFLAPGHVNFLLKRSGANYVMELNQVKLVNRHCPLVDVFFVP